MAEPDRNANIHSALSVRGVVIGAVGSAFIAASSLYIALKLGALPWPIVFASLVSLFFLKAMGHTSLNEANVTHTAMDGGAMVAGGLAFTIPGLWMIGQGFEIGLPELLVVSLSGTVLGLAACACVRRYFIDENDIAFPIGVSAAETLIDADRNRGVRTRALFASTGIAALYAWIRDGLGALPSVFFGNVKIPGVNFGIYNYPMMLAVGFLIGPIAGLVWLLGGFIGDFGIVLGCSQLGVWDISYGQGVKSSLGMGMMLGCGLGIVVLQGIPALSRLMKRAVRKGDAPKTKRGSEGGVARRKIYISASLASAAVAAVAAIALQLPLAAAVVLVLGAWVCVFVASQSVGVSGIDPMEVFGVLILLLVQLLFHDVSMVSLFLVAAVVAIACGLTGDMMNDFKAGAILKTNPRDQWIAQAIGAVVGAVVASVVLYAMLNAYGADAFGVGKTFVAAQAGVVAAMVGGVPNVAAFVIGAAIGVLLTCFKLPVMTLGLGIYLPFYISLTAAIGAIIRIFYDRVQAKKNKSGTAGENEGYGTPIAAGLLGGESLVGVVMAFVIMFSSL